MSPMNAIAQRVAAKANLGLASIPTPEENPTETPATSRASEGDIAAG